MKQHVKNELDAILGNQDQPWATDQEVLMLGDLSLPDAYELMMVLSDLGKLYDGYKVTEPPPGSLVIPHDKYQISLMALSLRHGELRNTPVLYVVVRPKGQPIVPEYAAYHMQVETLSELFDHMDRVLNEGEWYDDYEYWVTSEESCYCLFVRIMGYLNTDQHVPELLREWFHNQDMEGFGPWDDEPGIPWPMPERPFPTETPKEEYDYKNDPWVNRMYALNSMPEEDFPEVSTHYEYLVMSALDGQFDDGYDHKNVLLGLSKVMVTLTNSDIRWQLYLDRISEKQFHELRTGVKESEIE